MSDALNERLEYFSAAALTGLLANPHYTKPEIAKYMMAKGMTLERLAVLSATEIVTELEKAKGAMSGESKQGTSAVNKLNLIVPES